MAHARIGLKGIVSGVVALAFFAVLAASASAGVNEGSVTIHKRVCPAGAPVSDIFTECHGNPPSQAFTFSADGGASAAVDGSGNLTFDALSVGTHEFTETEGIPLEFVTLRVFCSNEVDGVATEVGTTVNSFSVDVASGDALTCDSYSIPEDLSGRTPTPEPTVALTAVPPAAATKTAGGAGTTTLPNTGAGGGGGSSSALASIVALLGGLLALAAVSFHRRYSDHRI
ncbi:MAG: hypothetical protein ACR2OO_06645 [Thermomicrobiales bacterium]